MPQPSSQPSQHLQAASQAQPPLFCSCLLAMLLSLGCRPLPLLLARVLGRRGFRALVVDEPGGGLSRRRLMEYDSVAELPMMAQGAGGSSRMHRPNVEVEVLYSTLNYKDAMVVEGRYGVAKGFPIVPGIDLAGRVVRSDSPAFQPDDEIVVTGHKIGQHVDGAFSERLLLPADWLLPRPNAFTLLETMAIGSAGVTAMMCIMHLEEAGGLRYQEQGEVLVTGAGGGVGSIAVAILAKLGYTVVASTGRAELGNYLRGLGAARVIGRLSKGDLSPTPPLGKQLWTAAIDTVGGKTLLAVLSQLKYRCAVASTGVAGGGELDGATVYPFILRGVRLLGVDSTLPVSCDGYDTAANENHAAEREEIWARLSADLSVPTLRKICAMAAPGAELVPLAEVGAWSERLLRGEVQGRLVVQVKQKKGNVH